MTINHCNVCLVLYIQILNWQYNHAFTSWHAHTQDDASFRCALSQCAISGFGFYGPLYLSMVSWIQFSLTVSVLYGMK